MGGVIHPIIVNHKSDGSYVVIEGNTRTLIYREFHEKGLAGQWSHIPAMVYENLSAGRIDAIRLQAHLVGPRPWDPYSKAKYLDHLRNCEHLTMAQIVDFCGGKSGEVSNYIDAYNDMEDYYRPLLGSDDQFDPTRFSSFVELQHSRIKEAILTAGFDKSHFSGWVKEGLISPQNTVRQLPRILGNQKSRAVFLKEGAQEALKCIDVPATNEVLVSIDLPELAREVSRRILRIEYSELQRYRADLASEKTEALLEAKDLLMQLCSDIVDNDE